jgi:hypothetical protein
LRRAPYSSYTLFRIASPRVHAHLEFVIESPGLAKQAPAENRKNVRRNSMIRKTKDGYKVLSEKSKKNLGGPYKTRAEAEKRLRQVEFFKHHK